MMLSCREATRLLSERQERDLRKGERMALSVHTLLCSGCRQFGRQVVFLRQAMRGFAAAEVENDTADALRPAGHGPADSDRS